MGDDDCAAEARRVRATPSSVFEFPHGAGGLEQSLVRVAASEACAVDVLLPPSDLVRDPAEGGGGEGRFGSFRIRLHMYS